MQRRVKGFTLIEMMIVVALIAILAAVALPAYNGYVNRSKIKTVQADLVALALNMENQYQRKLAYPVHTLTTTLTVQDKFKGWQPASSGFAFGVTSTTSTYSLTATGNAGGVSGCKVTLSNAAANNKTITTCAYSTGPWL